jgi:hypothetical protein
VYGNYTTIDNVRARIWKDPAVTSYYFRNIWGGATSKYAPSSGSSTGTGSEQTIPHGLAAIPVGCKAWIKYPISATRFMEKEIDFDATNIYPCVNTGIVYEWRIE